MDDLVLTQNRPLIGIFRIGVGVEQISSQIESAPAQLPIDKGVLIHQIYAAHCVLVR